MNCKTHDLAKLEKLVLGIVKKNPVNGGVSMTAKLHIFLKIIQLYMWQCV